jgi:hypothetical protein
MTQFLMKNLCDRIPNSESLRRLKVMQFFDANQQKHTQQRELQDSVSQTTIRRTSVVAFNSIDKK